MTEKQVLGFKPHTRLEHVSNQHYEHMQHRNHRPQRCDDSALQRESNAGWNFRKGHLAELRRDMGPIAFSAQYQQSPIPPGGTIIKRKWLTTYDRIDRQPGDRIIMSWDIALSEAETGDYSAGVVLLNRGEVFYILEVVRGRFRFDILKRKVIEVKQRYGSSTLVIEDCPISRGLIQSLSEQSISVTPYKPDTDKRARLIAQTDLFEAGSIRLPQRAGGLEDFIAELLAFPARHDDQVDALTQGLAWKRSRRGEWSCGVVRGMY